jgi:hypothetical protein
MPPIEERKYALANLLYRDDDGIAFNKRTWTASCRKTTRSVQQ